jgi:PIH1 CS-like domain
MEEYDGMNHEEAKYLVLLVTLPMLVRGHAIQIKVLDDIITLRVPNLYRLNLGLPCSVLEHSTQSYFDCKLRKLIITLPVRKIETIEEEEFAPKAPDNKTLLQTETQTSHVK